MAGRDLLFFDECAAKCVHLSHQEEECSAFSLGDRGTIYTSDTIANSQRMSTEINKMVLLPN